MISHSRAEQYTTFTVFGELTGQRSKATMMKLTVGRLREALKAPKTVLRVEPSQDKIRVDGMKGPIAEGELSKAQEFGSYIASELTAPT